MSAELVGCDEIKAFFEDGWIDEALFPVGSGKEAGADAEPGTFAAEL